MVTNRRVIVSVVRYLSSNQNKALCHSLEVAVFECSTLRRIVNLSAVVH